MAGVIVPTDNAREAAVVEGVEVIPVGSLPQAIAFLNGEPDAPEPFTLSEDDEYAQTDNGDALDFADVRGQEGVKRAVVVACAGRHNLAMIGPPGTGKTMLARRMGSILPPLSRREALETTRVYSAMGLLPPGVSLLDRRPVRTPHHSRDRPGSGRRRQRAQARRVQFGPQRHPVPRRAPGVRPKRARHAPRAFGGRRDGRQPRPRHHAVPGRLHARGRHEPLAPWRRRPRRQGQQVPRPPERPAAWTASTSTSRSPRSATAR